MATRLSDALELHADDLQKLGVFNGFVDLDSLFYVDPFLLKDVKTPELKKSYKQFKKHFSDVIKLIISSNQKGDIFWRNARSLLTFKEIPDICLGYSKNNNKGNAVGSKLADNLLNTASQIIDKGIQDPEIFELVGLLEEHFGPDRISDMTCRIIIGDLLNYTQRVTSELGLAKTIAITYKGSKYLVPKYRRPIILVPEEILTPLPIANSWHEMEIVSQHNCTAPLLSRLV